MEMDVKEFGGIRFCYLSFVWQLEESKLKECPLIYLNFIRP